MGIATLASTVLGAAVEAGLAARKNPTRYRASKKPLTATKTIKGKDGKLRKMTYTFLTHAPHIGW